MNALLNKDREFFQDILQQVVKTAGAWYNQQATRPPSLHVTDLDYQPVPEKGIGARAVLNFFQEQYASHMANSAGPRYFGFVTGGSTPASVAGDWLVSVYDQVMSGSNDSVAHALERQTIQFLNEFFQLGPAFSGTFVTGATMSNFVSLATARQWVGEQYNINVSEEGIPSHIPFKIISATPHSSILKSLSMLGLGRKSLVKIDTLPDREAIDVNQLEKYLDQNREPSIVVANAGTVNTVDFDDLQKIGELKKKYSFWFHVDGAFGGFARLSPSYQNLALGLELADTVTIDAHKWLNVPYDSAMQFTRHKGLQVKVFQNNAAYLGDPSLMPDSMHITPENSRRFRALPAWFSIMAYGREGYRDIVERNCRCAFELGQELDKTTVFELLAPVRMNVVCFTFRNQETPLDEIRSFLNAVRDDGQVFFTPTIYKGRAAIRAAISNWQTNSIDTGTALEVLNRIYSTWKKSTFSNSSV